MSSLMFAALDWPEYGAYAFTMRAWPKLFVPESSVVPIPRPIIRPSAAASFCFFFHSSHPTSSFATSSIFG